MLQALAALLTNSLREIDYCGRYGGEEFVIVLPDTNLAHAKEFAQRLLKKITTMKFQSDTNTIFHISASIGVSEYQTQFTSCEALVKSADNAMYQAKISGRNCVRESAAQNSD